MADNEAAPPWEPPLNGTEVEHLLGALDRQRATFRWKADGRGRAGLSTTVGASTMTLGGLLKHLALVEDHHSTAKLSGDALGDPWSSVSGGGDFGLEWTTAANDDPDFLYALYDGAVTRARERYAAALAAGGLDQRVHLGSDRGFVVSLRRLLFDLLEEYGRHTGHADLLSEAVDGRVGEDPPPDWVPVGAVDDGEGHEPAVPRFEQCRMLGATFRRVDLTGASFAGVDLDGAQFANANFRRVDIRSSDFVDVTITAGDLENVVINDVEIAPLVNAELDRRDPDRALAHPSDAAGFRRGWDLLERRWSETVAHARALPPGELHESVDGEWSFVETLRHLVFATQSWVGRGVLGDPRPWFPLALPWDEAPKEWDLPRDREARPTLDEVLAVRSETQAMVRTVLDGLTDEQLDTVPERLVETAWPPPGASVRDCLATVLNEEYAHRLFAERDLARLEPGQGALR